MSTFGCWSATTAPPFAEECTLRILYMHLGSSTGTSCRIICFVRYICTGPFILRPLFISHFSILSPHLVFRRRDTVTPLRCQDYSEIFKIPIGPIDRAVFALSKKQKKNSAISDSWQRFFFCFPSIKSQNCIITNDGQRKCASAFVLARNLNWRARVSSYLGTFHVECFDGGP